MKEAAAVAALPAIHQARPADAAPFLMWLRCVPWLPPWDQNPAGQPPAAAAKPAAAEEKQAKKTPYSSRRPTHMRIRTRAHKYEELERVFRCFDENGDGKISPTELQRCVRASVGEELSAEDFHALVASTDSDGDGLLCLHDFTRLVDHDEGEGEEGKGRTLREAFRVYEMDGEGHITPRSLRRALVRLGEPRSIDECAAMIRRFDINGDGVISFDEFQIMML